MDTQDFQIDGLVGKVRRWNKRCEFDKALYLTALAKLYPQAAIDMSQIKGRNEHGNVDVTSIAFSLDVQAGVTLYNLVTDFADLAARIVECHNLSDESGDFTWPRATATGGEIDRAFKHVMDNTETWGEVNKLIEVFEMPNGVEGAPLNKLTDEQRANPLSVSNGKSSRKQSVAS